MWGILISIGILALDYGLHALFDQSTPPKPVNEFQLPQVNAGTPYPLIYGRCRLRQPVLEWCDEPIAVLNTLKGPAVYDYAMSMHLVLGLGFLDGEQHIYNMWAGDAKMYTPIGSGGSYGATTIHGLSDLVGDGNVEDALPSGRGWQLGYQENPADNTSYVAVGGAVEFLNGNTSQLIVGDVWPYNALTRLGEHMTETVTVGGQPENSLFGTIDPQKIGSYRGVLSVFLFGHTGGLHWFVGTSPVAQSYNFEVGSYPASSAYPSGGSYMKIGTDANPADVIYDVLTGWGKLGIDPARIDLPSFGAAAYTLWTENHGYSRAIEGSRSGADIINEVLVQIAACTFEDPTTGKLGLKLIRNDYNPPDLPVIDASNCSELKNVTLSGWVGLPNKITVTFTDNTNDYNQGSATAQNMANAVGQDGIVTEQVLDFPGITNAATARDVAQRELATRSCPLMRFTAVCDRSRASLKQGDPVKVNWTDPDIAGGVFRVVAIDRGTVTDTAVTIDLVQDPYFVWNNRPPVLTGFGGHGDVTGLPVF